MLFNLHFILLNGSIVFTENSYVQNLLEASKRQSNNKPRVKKDHISSEHIIELCSKYSDSTDLMIVRDLAMILLMVEYFYFNLFYVLQVFFVLMSLVL